MRNEYDPHRLNIGDLVKVRQSWSNLGSRMGVVVQWWDDTPIGNGHPGNRRFSYEVMFFHTQKSEDFYDYQLELLSEAKKKKT